MKVVFVSNYFNHHQKPLSDALYEQTDGKYCFVETETITEERLKMGWGSEVTPDYVIKSYKSANSAMKCQAMVDDADVVILGSASYEWIRKRLREKKLTFCYSERLYKTGYEFYKWPIRLIRLFLKYTRYKTVYMLCASAYTAADFALTGTFLNKTYKWGYFPKVKKHDVDALMSKKKRNSLVWCGRFIALKHPDDVLRVAERLKNDGYDFELNFIGTGPMEQQLRQMTIDLSLEDRVHFLGSMKPEQVREQMEEAGIYLFTSDRQEGWGAVLNESMNSGCAIVASHAIGSVPFLLEDKKNGLIYKDGDLDDLYMKVRWILDHNEDQIRMGKEAYITLTQEWNPENAAKKFLDMSKKLLDGKKQQSFNTNGICSRAEIIRNNWYR